ncbi:MAG: thioredoxin family protein [Verrucomicrobia bacterium]|nr:thioredoxin family protein [Verrucomicrobiota bacterium]
MKKLITICSLLCWATLPLAIAAEGEWLTDLPKAQAKAKAEKKLVLMDFTGSDWCPPCKALHKNVLSSPEFIQFAKANLVLVEVDFPRSKPQSAALKKANQALSEKYAIEGYPTIIVLDADGNTLSKETGYGGTAAKDYVLKLEKLKKK